MIVAIDGPAGAGKSTIAARVARRLGFQLIDTGALYRAVAYEAMQRGIDTDDPAAVAELAGELAFDFETTADENIMYCDGRRMGDEIRTSEVSQLTSVISSYPEVRDALLEVQRELGREESSVLEGRDIGTVVFPDAEVKVFLTASAEERARRRYEQIVDKGESADFDAILAEIRERDARDRNRDVAPLTRADDAERRVIAEQVMQRGRNRPLRN
ncbi:MAG: (d)CMP kinase, partial [Bradymonadaceae bacterium]